MMSNITNTPVVQNLIINFIGFDQFTSLMPLLKLINEHNGNIVASRISQLGEHFSGLLLVDGPWNTIAQIENSLNSLAEKYELKILFERTTSDIQIEDSTNYSHSETRTQKQQEFLPYKISIHNIDEPGLLEKMVDFFKLQEITIQDLATTTYASEYSSHMVQLEIKIKIPSDLHIPSLKEQFDILCYNENLDATLVPSRMT